MPALGSMKLLTYGIVDLHIDFGQPDDDDLPVGAEVGPDGRTDPQVAEDQHNQREEEVRDGKPRHIRLKKEAKQLIGHG